MVHFTVCLRTKCLQTGHKIHIAGGGIRWYNLDNPSRTHNDSYTEYNMKRNELTAAQQKRLGLIAIGIAKGAEAAVGSFDLISCLYYQPLLALAVLLSLVIRRRTAE